MTATVDLFAPADREAAVMEIVREAGTPVTLRSIAVAVRRRHTPASNILDVQCAVAATLDDLTHAGRLIRRRSEGGNVPAWVAACADDNIERRIIALQQLLGGRPVEVVGGNPADPTIAVMAPLSIVESLAS